MSTSLASSTQQDATHPMPVQSTQPLATIVIPCYNELENLQVLLPTIHARKVEFEGIYTFWFIGQQTGDDATRSLVESYGFKFLNRENGDRYGDAVRTAVRHVDTTYIGFMDADNSHSLDFFDEAIPHLESRPSLVVASRYLSGGKTQSTFSSQLMSKLLNSVFRLVMSTSISDISNSQKLYRRDLLSKELRSDNFDIIEEMAWMVLRDTDRQQRQASVVEISAVFEKRIHGDSKRELFTFIRSYLVTAARITFLRFLLGGAPGLLLNVVSFIVLQRYFDAYIASLVSFMIAVSFNYVSHGMYTFRRTFVETLSLAKYVAFVSGYAVGGAVNVGLVYVGVNALGLNALLVQLAGICLSVLCNFIVASLVHGRGRDRFF